jgi:hypothetical protein
VIGAYKIIDASC